MGQNITVSDAAKLLHVTPVRVRQYIAAGQLRIAERVGVSYLLKRSEVEKFTRPKMGRPKKVARG